MVDSETGISRLGDRLTAESAGTVSSVTEQTQLSLPDGELDFVRRLGQLAQRAERTAHNRSNIVGPPPSQEHLDLLAEIRALTESHVAYLERYRGAEIPQPAVPIDDRLGVPDPS
ncbi:hypothetical protein Lesp02_45110 [Lentzea sp. NBRC 105346]|nr:hypothetical protein Lesp02_45110 [Lentzea sp. NBRC 105346]